MKTRRQWRWMMTAAVLAFGIVTSQSHAFVESTDTEGELPSNISGVWLLVTHLEFTRPTPIPEAGATPTPAPSPGAAAPIRYFNVVTLMRFVHLPKEAADKIRAADKKQEEASVEKAKAMIAEELKKSPPVQTESGEVESDVKVLVPAVSARRQPGDGDDVDAFLLDVAYPKSIQDAIDKAQKAEKPWDPTDKDLAVFKSSWNHMKPSGRDEFSKIEWKITGSDKFDDNLRLDATTRDAKFVIVGNQELIPKPNVPKSNIVVYGVEQVKDETLAGKHTRAMMAAAPFPIPIEMRGTFKMYKIGDLPKASGEKVKAAKKSAKP
jgi:hypothetical protein